MSRQAPVREDYSPDGDAWNFFIHDHARSRAYRWGEEAIAGISDDKQRLCFALALWNGKDPVLKERLFGLTNSEADHGEDVKEYYFYLDSTPTHSYTKDLYKYPQAPYPYEDLVRANGRRSWVVMEYEFLFAGGVASDGLDRAGGQTHRAARLSRPPQSLCLRHRCVIQTVKMRQGEKMKPGVEPVGNQL